MCHVYCKVFYVTAYSNFAYCCKFVTHISFISCFKYKLLIKNFLKNSLEIIFIFSEECYLERAVCELKPLTLSLTAFFVSLVSRPTGGVFQEVGRGVVTVAAAVFGAGEVDSV